MELMISYWRVWAVGGPRAVMVRLRWWPMLMVKGRGGQGVRMEEGGVGVLGFEMGGRRRALEMGRAGRGEREWLVGA